MWSTCRSLQHLVIDVIKNGQESRLLELEVSLVKHKDLFLFPLKPLGKDSSHREAVKRSAKEPISLPYVQQKVALSQDFIDEVLVLSDLFEANELLMVELLLTAIIDTLRTIILSREGRAWSPSLSEGIIEVIQKFTSDLWDCGFLYNVIGTLKSFDATKEFSRLERAQALGASKHRHDVYQLLRNIQNTLSECVLLWSCQSALSISEFRLVLDCFLHSEVPREDNAHETQQETSMKSPIPISHSRAHLLMSLLYTLDPFPLFAISPEQLSELSEEDLSHPLYSDRTFACTIGQLLDDEKNSLEALADPDSSDRAAVVALLRLAWAICLRRTVHLRHELSRRQQNQLTRSPTTSPTPGGSDNRNLVDNSYGVDEDEELQAAMGIEAGALEFIRKRLLQVVGFDREVLWFCRVHSIITDLIVHMPNRVKEIRLRDENLLRRTGFDPASTGSGFANFLLLIAELYNQPGSRLHARFSLEYWWPSGELAVMGMTTGGTLTGFQGAEFFPGLRGFPTRSPSKAVTLQNRNSETDNIRQDPVARSLFASTTHWQVIPTCIGLLSCPISLGLKADLLHLLTALSRSSTIGTLIWRHITMSELFPVSLQRTTQQPLTPCGLNTEMDEVEPRVEEYPVTRAFLALTTVLMPQLIEVSRDVGGGGGGGGGGSSNNINVTGPVGRPFGPDTKDMTLPTSEESALLQSTSLVATIKFLTNSVFLKHNMRAYRDPNERWDIAAACLVLFDGCVEQFLTRLDSAAAVVLNTLPNSKTASNLPLTDRHGPGSGFSDATHSFDWASALLTGVCEMENEPPATQSRLRSQTHSSLSSMATLLGQLRLPPGWPYSDPGFYLSTQLLSDSAVFRTLTGLLEVGLHRMLEYPLPDGPPVGMVHATAAGLQLIRRLLAQEETLHTFLRRTTNNPSFGVLRVHTHTLALPGPSGLNSTVLPTCLSRLLLSINARTGRADLLSTLLRFGIFAEELPDHCAHMMDILRSLVTRIRPHSDLLAVLTADESSRRELLGIFAGLIKWSTQCDVNELATESGGDDQVVARLAVSTRSMWIVLLHSLTNGYFTDVS
ncbi:hypothetical protein FGIG_01795 [Fasciola gigantica]|uniref:Nuclear pore complex protein Nup205 n=1 Tax=Fasciola gigantica TaxID=46835 RepID=A0A504YRD3_FASGI|nr:hypothetical protein FGIG_01795 [Fasciola gigantica]